MIPHTPVFLAPEHTSAGLDVTEAQLVHAPSLAMLTEQLRAQDHAIEVLTERLEDTAAGHDVAESLAMAELSLEDAGWRRLTAESDVRFTRNGLIRASAVARAMAVTNALVSRGLALRIAYIWGAGVQVTCKATGPTDDNRAAQDVNAVLQAFWDDPGNKAAFTGEQAHEEAERALGTDGNVFLTCFTGPRTGSVQARWVPSEQVDQILTNPDDVTEPWFYRRAWTRMAIDYATGEQAATSQLDYYPALGYRPSTRPATMAGAPIHWDAPMLHVSVNRLQGWTFGIGDIYNALPWARAYSTFLQDWAQLVQSLSKIAYQQTTAGSKVSKVAAQARAAAQRATLTGTGGGAGDAAHSAAGATVVTSPDVKLEAVSKSGATIDSDSGRPLAAMIAAALDLPVTWVLGDPGVTGARATAETLNDPSKLSMQARRMRWTEAIRALCAHVVREAVRAPSGPLQGSIRRDEHGRETVTLAGDTDATVDVAWPSLDHAEPTLARVQAIVAAEGTGTLPPREVARLLLQALDVEDVDAVLEEMTDPDTGEFLDPAITAGAAAVAAFRTGRDPAALLNGDIPAQRGAPARDQKDQQGVPAPAAT